MDISQAKLDKFLSTLASPRCSLCGRSQWNANTKLFYLGEYNKDALVLGGPVYPVLPITCTHCGNTLFINALVAGLLEQDKNNGKK